MREEEYTIVKKAWKIQIDQLLEPWHYNDMFELADTSNMAKSQFIKGGRTIDMSIWSHSDTRDVEYSDLRASRYKDKDIVLFEGVEVSRDKVKNIVWMRNRDAEAEELVSTNPDGTFVIYAGCYGSYWGANKAGYSMDIAYAGKYSGEEALGIVRNSDFSRQEVVRLLSPDHFNSEIDLRIAGLQEKIDRLKSCMI